MKCVYSDCPNSDLRHFLAFNGVGQKVLISFCSHHACHVLDSKFPQDEISDQEAALWEVQES